MSTRSCPEPQPAPLRPVPQLEGAAAYGVPRPLTPTDLALDGNEGPAPPAALLAELAHRDPALLRDYPRAAHRALEAQIAARRGLDPARVLVTAGGDDALDRACRSVLGPGRTLLFPSPSFEMLARYARLTGAEVREIPWPEGPYPTQRVLAAVDERTGMIAVVSPNNPTGAVARAEDLRRLCERAPHALVLLDLAYAEFAEQDALEPIALSLPNALVVRTLSKAYGLAGLRVGYALGPERVIAWMRAAGAPYPVAGPSLALAGAWLERAGPALERHVAHVRRARTRLASLLERLGSRPLPSQANFVLAHFAHARWVHEALAGLGIAVRRFPGRAGLEHALRISIPASEDEQRRLEAALTTVLAPEALLFDMDGVLADVAGSYREAIRRTAAAFGLSVPPEAIEAEKARGDANNDWVLTHRLLARAGIERPLEEVVRVFERHYQGEGEQPGLWRTERLLFDRPLLERLRARLRLGIVTGRPRRDAERFLHTHGIAPLFDALVCMEDTARPKPDPAPLRLALERLGLRHAWFVGDTVDDVRAARAAGLLPLGFAPPGADLARLQTHLAAAGAARTLTEPTQIEELLP